LKDSGLAILALFSFPYSTALISDGKSMIPKIFSAAFFALPISGPKDYA
jgi:hypothetical protein